MIALLLAVDYFHSLFRRHGKPSHGCPKPFVVDAVACRKVLENDSNATGINKNVIASRLPLLNRRSPSAVAWFVVAVWIDSIKSCSRRATSHVIKKGGERFGPFGAHRYSATAVGAVFIIGWVEASPFSVSPSAMLWGFLIAYGVTMLERSLAGHLFLKASATAYLSCCDMISSRLYFGAAVAQEKPEGSAASIVCSGYGNKPSISLTGKICGGHLAIH